MERIRLGLIGLSVNQGWALMAHLPALKMLADKFEIRAVATTNMDSAARTAQAVGAAHAFDNNDQLIACPDVDLVCVLVNVGQHHAPVLAALKAGKMVLSEWPLGSNLAEAQEMADAAKAAGVRTFVGLQGRRNPAVRYLADLVRDGFVGEVLSTTVVGSGLAWGAEITPNALRSMDVTNGGTLLTISTGHTLDSIAAVLGGIEDVSAVIANRRPQVRRVDTGEMIPKTSPDQVLFAGRLKSGAPMSYHYRGGLSRGTNFLWEINGTKGDIVVTRASGQLQYGDVQIRGGAGDDKALKDMPVPAEYFILKGKDEPPFSVGYAYDQIWHDLKDGTHLAADFDEALRHHQLIDAIQRSADTGQRVAIAG